MSESEFVDLKKMLPTLSPSRASLHQPGPAHDDEPCAIAESIPQHLGPLICCQSECFIECNIVFKRPIAVQLLHSDFVDGNLQQGLQKGKVHAVWP